MKMEPGEFVGIIGSTGSGKSTFVSLIPRLYDPDAGEVLVDGINVKELSLYELRESVAVVLQKNTLFSGTIAENLRWGNEEASDESKLPENEFSEFAFAGKSNVGKSSLINGLISRKAYARTSAEPGKTQTINYYKVEYREKSQKEIEAQGLDASYAQEKSVYFVDLPGYGFAKVSMETKEKWGKMIESYLHTSKPLKGVFLLVDIRHKPSANDCQMFDWMVNSGFSPVVIATKLDKIKRSQLSARVKEIRSTLGMKSSEVLIPFSAETKQGREEIWAYIDSKNKEEE